MGFLTLEQRQRYGHYESEPTPMQLARYFHLDDTDKDSVLIRRGNHNRLGFALQLVSVRFLGTFLENPIDIPLGVIIYVATQLGISDIECLPRYLERSVTHWEHQGEIQQRYGYRNFSVQPGHWQLVRWLYGRAWVGSESPSVLFDLVTARLVEHKILLPGVTVLERLVASVRERTAKRLWRILSKIPSLEQREKLEALLIPDEKTWYTPLDQLRRSPTRHSSAALINALNRLVKVRSLGVNTLNFSGIPASRLKALARHAATIRVQAIARMPFERRIATLLAFIHTLEAEAADDTLDVLELLIKAGQSYISWSKGRVTPTLPGGTRGPTFGFGLGRQCFGTMEYILYGCCTDFYWLPTEHKSRRCSAAIAFGTFSHQYVGTLSFLFACCRYAGGNAIAA